MGASPGGFGTILSQNAWLPVIRTLGMQPWFGKRLMVSRAGQVFNEAGELIDDQIRGQLQQFLQGFAEFARRE
jgi:NAD(P)H-dependent FMN reductase